MKKQTAVEWLVDELRNHIKEHGRLDAITISKLKMQAKAMEKDQISEAFLDGVYRASPSDLDYENFKETGEQYYNNTFL